MIGYEDNKLLPRPWGWVIIIALCLAILGWGVLNWRLIRDVPRQWNSGALPDTPAGSVYSSFAPAPGGTVPLQIVPLPLPPAVPATAPAEKMGGTPSRDREPVPATAPAKGGGR